MIDENKYLNKLFTYKVGKETRYNYFYRYAMIQGVNLLFSIEYNRDGIGLNAIAVDYDNYLKGALEIKSLPKSRRYDFIMAAFENSEITNGS